MLIQASNLINLPVAATETRSKIGYVKQLVINPENGQLIAFLVAVGGFFALDKLLSCEDVLAIEKTGVVTRSPENLLAVSEIVRAKKILEKKIIIIHQKAFTESKKYLGRIFDYLLDTQTQIVFKYYLHHLFSERILPANKVVKINEKGVFFSDDVIEETPLAEAEGAAA